MKDAGTLAASGTVTDIKQNMLHAFGTVTNIIQGILK